MTKIPVKQYKKYYFRYDGTINPFGRRPEKDLRDLESVDGIKNPTNNRRVVINKLNYCIDIFYNNEDYTRRYTFTDDHQPKLIGFECPAFDKFMQFVSCYQKISIPILYSLALRRIIQYGLHFSAGEIILFKLRELGSDLRDVFPRITKENFFNDLWGFDTPNTEYTRFNENFDEYRLRQFIEMGLDVTKEIEFEFSADFMQDDLYDTGYKVKAPVYVYLSDTPEKFKVMLPYIKDHLPALQLKDHQGNDITIIDCWANFSGSPCGTHFEFTNYDSKCFLLYLQHDYFSEEFYKDYLYGDSITCPLVKHGFINYQMRTLQDWAQISAWKGRVNLKKLPKILLSEN